MPETLALPRLRQLRGLRVQAASRQLLQAVLRHPVLRRLDARNTDLSSLPPDLLGQVAARMDEVLMNATCLEPAQAKAVLRAAALPGSRLHTLHLGDNRLDGVPPEALSAAAGALRRLEVPEAGVTAAQAVALMATLGAGGAALTHLDIRGNPGLAGVPGELLGRGIRLLQTAVLRHCSLQRHQLEGLLEVAVAQPSRLDGVLGGAGPLQELDLEGNPGLRDLSPGRLDSARQAVRRLRVQMDVHV
jgi:hypothetical protein